MSRSVEIRPATPADLETVAGFFHALWSDATLDEHRQEAEAVVAGTPASTMPLVILIATRAGAPVGFVEVGLRSHADGCDARHPVGFVEGWYVDPAHRRSGVGGALMNAAEEWARARGCREIASDTWIDHEDSQRAHEALGFEVVDRCVNFRKALTRK